MADGKRRPDLEPIDRVDVLVLVDNATDQLSTNPDGVRSEFDQLLAAGLTEIAGETICSAHHGLSLLVTVHRGDTRHVVLFDTGPEAYGVERNGRHLAVDFGAVGSLVLSHGHWDHCGGALKALELMQVKRAGPPPGVYAHPGMFQPRGRRMENGDVIPMRGVPTEQQMADAGARVSTITAPQLLHDGTVFLSGEIPRVTPYERGLANHLRRAATGWEPDPLIMDERFLAVHVRDRGLVVLTGCSHAGVVNVLRHARTLFPDVPLFAVMGGLHLSGAGPEKLIGETVRDLGTFGLRRILAGHCTGWRALTALLGALGEGIVTPTAVGKRFTWER